MKMRIIIAIVLAVALFAGCAGGPGGAPDSSDGFLDPGGEPATGGQQDDSSDPDDATDKLLYRVIDMAGETLNGANALPETVMEPVTVESAPAMLGLLKDDFVAFAEDATVVQSRLNVHAFQAAIVKSKDKESALIINEQIISNFDSGKWIEVFPEQSLTILSGSYVFLAVGTKEQTKALADAFKSLSGASTNVPTIFYEGETGGDIGPIEF